MHTCLLNAGRTADRNDKQAIFKNCAPFTHCISEINNTQVDNAKDLDIVMLVYYLIEYSNNNSKDFENLYQFCRDEPKNLITDSESFTFKSRFLINTDNIGIINANIAVPFVNSEINTLLT